MPPLGPDPGAFYQRRRRRLATTLEALRRRYAPRPAAPRPHRGTFVAPIDLPERLFAPLRLQKVQQFIAALQRMGWVLVLDRAHPLRLESGACPAFDLRDGVLREGAREYVVTAWFALPDPQPLRIALPPWYTAVTPSSAREKG